VHVQQHGLLYDWCAILWFSAEGGEGLIAAGSAGLAGDTMIGVVVGGGIATAGVILFIGGGYLALHEYWGVF
jgi:hypothetical protein